MADRKSSTFSIRSLSRTRRSSTSGKARTPRRYARCSELDERLGRRGPIAAVSAIATDPSWPGLSRPSTLFLPPLIIERVLEIIPGGIGVKNQTHLPCPRPVLVVRFALNGGANRVMKLHGHKSLQSVSFREPRARRLRRHRRAGRCGTSHPCRARRSAGSSSCKPNRCASPFSTKAWPDLQRHGRACPGHPRTSPATAPTSWPSTVDPSDSRQRLWGGAAWMAGTSPAMTGGDFLPHSAGSPTSTYSAPLDGFDPFLPRNLSYDGPHSRPWR